MIALLQVPQHQIYFDTDRNVIDYCVTADLGNTWEGIAVDITTRTIIAGDLNNKVAVVEMCDGIEAIREAADTPDEIEAMCDEYIITDLNNLFDFSELVRKSDETDADYCIRLWSICHGNASMSGVVEELGGDRSDDAELVGDGKTWGVFEMPDGSIVTESDSDETAWANRQEIIDDLERLEAEHAQAEADHQAFLDSVFSS